ncbi:hypothetical protein [Anaerobacillus sp. 1_MG-2023]|uniref:hypothetical protein n=1 Tax=Anaerobacillus sp. 1_MG-2023 TaxID=3062655 RepID=UPI0026E2A31C|nr:hypothetical protein [Anaerobacillus sp. 1_MG-2023]MDO6657472.1 hypothetical protein [Anaerobacillus sp. 1_MG-2023]
MNSAILQDGKVVSAKEYISSVHGTRLYCMDRSCNAPVIYVPGSDNVAVHYKTTGKSDSRHNEHCAFYKPLNFFETVKKVGQFQTEYEEQVMNETIIRINLNKLDPDYESRVIEREETDQKKKDPNEVKVKQESNPPSSIGSLKSIVKLLTSYEADILSTIMVSVRGNKIPISSIVVDQGKAHKLVWKDSLIEKTGYFVYGKVERILRREKVYFISMAAINGIEFSLVIFDKYFKHFTYSDAQLIGKDILAYGFLRKNTYHEKNTTEMIIKSDKFIEFL